MEFLASLIPFIVLMAIMYFLMIRPQQQQAQKKQEMLDNMKPGDEVVTIGGLHGVVDEVDDSSKTVVLDCEGVYLTFTQQAIASVTGGADVIERQEEIREANEIAEDDYQETIEEETQE